MTIDPTHADKSDLPEQRGGKDDGRQRGPFEERIEIDLAKGWLSLDEISQYLGVTSYVILKQISSRNIPAIKVGREWRISRQDLETWLNQERQQVWDDTELDESQSEDTPSS